MGGPPEPQRCFTRRALLIGAGQIGVLGLLGARLGWLQIAEGQRYKMLSDKNRINIKIIAPSRGQIVDRGGVILASNSQNFRVMVIPEQTDNLEKAVRALQDHISVDEQTIKTILRQARRAPKFAPLQIKENLSWEEVAKIEVNLPDLPGLFIDVGERRNYPLGPAAAHVIGYVGAVNESEMTDDPILSLPGYKIGKTGIEKSRDLDMRGIAGASEVEVNVVGREVRELDRKDSLPGKKISLTIDAALQAYTQQRLAQQQSASAVLMDAHTGKIYALASHPSFDPNVFSSGIPAALWDQLLNDPANPLTNKAVAGLYPPASTFKIVTAMAGLLSGKITEGRRVFCPGYYNFGNTVFHCWRKGGHGSVNVVEALEHSCDTFFYQVSTDIGIDAIAQTARRFGLGTRMDIGLPETKAGLVPDPKWKRARFKQPWHQGETIVASIGQGYLLATPLHLAVMTARVVNGGKAVMPWLSADQAQTGAWPDMDIPPAFAALVREGLEKVVNNPGGTAFAARIQDPGLGYGGKTGTAQVRRITKQQRASGVKNEELPWEQRHHALFAGYAPLNAPRYVCAVVVEHGVGGSVAAAPIARDLLLEIQKRQLS